MDSYHSTAKMTYAPENRSEKDLPPSLPAPATHDMRRRERLTSVGKWMEDKLVLTGLYLVVTLSLVGLIFFGTMEVEILVDLIGFLVKNPISPSALIAALPHEPFATACWAVFNAVVYFTTWAVVILAMLYLGWYALLIVLKSMRYIWAKSSPFNTARLDRRVETVVERRFQELARKNGLSVAGPGAGMAARKRRGRERTIEFWEIWDKLHPTINTRSEIEKLVDQRFAEVMEEYASVPRQERTSEWEDC